MKTAAWEAAATEELLRGFKKRFEKSLPLKNINLVFIESKAVAAAKQGQNTEEA